MLSPNETINELGTKCPVCGEIKFGPIEYEIITEDGECTVCEKLRFETYD